MNDKESVDYNQPVAYDAEGRPLYARPPQAVPTTNTTPFQPSTHPNVELSHRPHTDSSTNETDDLHTASKKKYPTLNLSEGEYVIEEIHRHPVGLLPIYSVAGVLIFIGLTFLFLYPAIEESMAFGAVPPFSTVLLPVSMVMLLGLLLAYIASSVYNNNRFFLTNESVIERTQNSLFAHKERTVGLHSIEEVTFSRSNLLQNMFGYGTVDLTIEGHTVYHFPYIGDPKERVDLIVNTVEKAKAHH